MRDSNYLPTKQKILAQWLLANPTAKQYEAARVFGVSQGWVSQVVNSDAFRDYLENLHRAVDSEVLVPLRSRLEAVATRSLDKLETAVDHSIDPKFLLEVADKTLHRLGYAPSRGPQAPTVAIQQNNVYTAPADALKAAREKMHNAAFEPSEGRSDRLEHLAAEPQSLPAPALRVEK